MAKEPITTRLDTDTKQEVQDYADDRDIGQTEATRRLIRAGLAAEGYPVATTDGGDPGPLERLADRRTAATGALLLALSLIPLWTAATAATAGTTTGALLALGLTAIPMGLGVVTIAAAALAQLALDRPLRALASGQESAT